MDEKIEKYLLNLGLTIEFDYSQENVENYDDIFISMFLHNKDEEISFFYSYFYGKYDTLWIDDFYVDYDWSKKNKKLDISIGICIIAYILCKFENIKYIELCPDSNEEEFKKRNKTIKDLIKYYESLGFLYTKLKTKDCYNYSVSREIFSKNYINYFS